MTEPDPMASTEWHVGAETDATARARLGDALRAGGYCIDAGSWTLGGSQEVSVWTARRPDGELRIEEETYVGLTVRGPRAGVEALRVVFSGLEDGAGARDGKPLDALRTGAEASRPAPGPDR